MSKQIRNVVVVGGGTAGWLAASLIAARHHVADQENGIHITLIESPDIPTVGVGEGTWPTMRKTLKRIGLNEEEFLATCDASFKQGSRFDGWVTGNKDDSYLHPFAALINGPSHDLYRAWKALSADRSFANVMCPQTEVCAQGLAPKQKNSPEYAAALNYAYHLDAVKLAKMLTAHATKNLGVVHIRDHVVEVVGDKDKDISAVKTRENGNIEGDLFIDCTGHRSVLLGQHYGVGFVDKSDILFNDRALTIQVPYADESTQIASQTISTAHDNGWIWDIGLPTRRGIGCVYSSRHCSDDEARSILEQYVRSTGSTIDLDELGVRKLEFPSGYREKFWHRNCVAIGLSAGFLEPLEASALVLVELSAEMLAENFPGDRTVMDILAKRFNALFAYRWERIIDFLKLHYVLSKRENEYWQDHRMLSTIPQRLQELLLLWKQQPPGRDDFSHIDEVFPAASYLYVLYGMGFETTLNSSLKPLKKGEVIKQMQMVEQKIRTLTAVLPTNRSLLTAISKGVTPVKNISERIA
ncbi:MAG: tryptophan 7-halogenase [Gammaproteobacteria bacterium]|nr:tryptophan 7-halogenase [Gammaproteobacteria bacterium]NNC97589.1 tryptophan 7-halogenase [Gammaproteobacteria bacterium]NNM14794.1 tryptophan 7-halogenase [Gammaproteobacteria bacterium]